MENIINIVLTIGLVSFIVGLLLLGVSDIYNKGRQDFKKEFEKNPIINMSEGGTDNFYIDGKPVLKITNIGGKLKVEILNKDLMMVSKLVEMAT